VRILVRRHGHMVAWRRVSLRSGHYRLRLRLPAHAGRVTVLVRAGDAHVARRFHR
jgi:hypothetical protein